MGNGPPTTSMPQNRWLYIHTTRFHIKATHTTMQLFHDQRSKFIVQTTLKFKVHISAQPNKFKVHNKIKVHYIESIDPGRCRGQSLFYNIYTRIAAFTPQVHWDEVRNEKRSRELRHHGGGKVAYKKQPYPSPPLL